MNLFLSLFLLIRKCFSFLEPVICRWVKGAREGQGTVSTLNLEEVNLRFVIVNNMVTSATVYIMFCSAFSFPIVVTVP